MKKIILSFTIILFSSSAFSLHEYDYCSDVYESAGQFKEAVGSNKYDIELILITANMLAETYAYRNNSDDPDKLAKEAYTAVQKTIRSTHIDKAMDRGPENRPQVAFLGKCMKALKNK